MECPRCNVENDDKRISCWSCFAQLRQPEDSKPHKIEIKKEEETPEAEPEMEPVTAPAADLDSEAEVGISPAEEPEIETFFTPALTIDLDVSSELSPAAQELDETPSPVSSNVLDLDESADPTGYIVPGLAEPVHDVDAEEKSETPIMADAVIPMVVDEEPPAAVDEVVSSEPEIELPAAVNDEPAVEQDNQFPADDWLDMPVFNPDAMEEESAAPVAEQASNNNEIKASANVKPDSEKGRKPNFLLPIVIIALILVALAVWWFKFANPSPEPVAEEFITAMNLAISGDSNRLKTICTASSQADIDSGAQAFGRMKPQGLAMQMSAGKVEGVIINDNQAEVKLNLSIAFGATQMQVNMPMRVALLREGPIFNRQWKVDLPATNRLGAEDSKQMVEKMFPGGLPKNIPAAAPTGAYPAPR